MSAYLPCSKKIVLCSGKHLIINSILSANTTSYAFHYRQELTCLHILFQFFSFCKGWNKTNQFSYQFNLTLILLFTYSDTNRVKQNNICVKSQKWVDRRVFHARCAHRVWCGLPYIGTTRAQLIPLSSSRVVMHTGTGRFGHTPFRPQDNCGDVSATWYFGITLCPFRPHSYIRVNYITDLSIIILFRCTYFIFVIWYN